MCAICTDKSGGQFGYAGLWCDCDKLIDSLYYRDHEFMIELFRKDGLIEKTFIDSTGNCHKASVWTLECDDAYIIEFGFADGVDSSTVGYVAK